MREPAVYLVAVFNQGRAPWNSYFSEAVYTQFKDPEDLALYLLDLEHLFRDPPDPVFNPDLDAHPWGAILLQQGGSRGSASLTWWPLPASPIYFDEWSAAPYSFRGAPRFTAAPQGEHCVLQWRSPSLPSPFPGGAPHVELVHGARFAYADHHYVVWVEPKGTWSVDEPASPSDPQVLDEIRTLGNAALAQGSKRFLALPRVSRWWGEEFMRLTGIVPSGREDVPYVHWSGIGAVDGGFVLRWTVVSGQTALGFFRTLRGADLVVLRDCATVLHHLCVVPEVDRYDLPIPPMQEIEAELAFLQVERERLEDPIRRNQLRYRMRVLGGTLHMARERAASEAAEAARIEAAGGREPPLTARERQQRGLRYPPFCRRFWT
jgi:hypothetical protein